MLCSEKSNSFGCIPACLDSSILKNNSPCSGCMPDMLMFGREVNLPIELLFPQPVHTEMPDVHPYVANLNLQLLSVIIEPENILSLPVRDRSVITTPEP